MAECVLKIILNKNISFTLVTLSKCRGTILLQHQLHHYLIQSPPWSRRWAAVWSHTTNVCLLEVSVS